MQLMQLIYTSRPFGFDDATLTGILVTARHNNPRLDITGALICRADIYLQLLKGRARRSRSCSAGSRATTGIST